MEFQNPAPVCQPARFHMLVLLLTFSLLKFTYHRRSITDGSLLKSKSFAFTNHLSDIRDITRPASSEPIPL